MAVTEIKQAKNRRWVILKSEAAVPEGMLLFFFKEDGEMSALENTKLLGSTRAREKIRNGRYESVIRTAAKNTEKSNR